MSRGFPSAASVVLTSGNRCPAIVVRPADGPADTRDAGFLEGRVKSWRRIAASLALMAGAALAGCAADKPPEPPPTMAEIAITAAADANRSEEHTSELQSLMRISYAVFCLKTKKNRTNKPQNTHR